MSNGQKARLLSPAFSTAASQICVQFVYYMYGTDYTNVLRVLKKTDSAEEEIWKRTGSISPSWLNGAVTVSKPSSQSVTVSPTFSYILTWLESSQCATTHEGFTLKIQVCLKERPSVCLQVVFEAQRGLSSSCDSALDNIVITEGACLSEFSQTFHKSTCTFSWR